MLEQALAECGGHLSSRDPHTQTVPPDAPLTPLQATDLALTLV